MENKLSLNLNEYERERYLKTFKKLSNLLNNVINKLELKNDEETIVEFLLLSVVGSTLIQEFGNRIKREVQKAKYE